MIQSLLIIGIKSPKWLHYAGYGTFGAIVFIVAQRISTIMDADKIIVLNEGDVVGVGTHEELLKSCNIYYEIAESQLTKEELGL